MWRHTTCCESPLQPEAPFRATQLSGIAKEPVLLLQLALLQSAPLLLQLALLLPYLLLPLLLLLQPALLLLPPLLLPLLQVALLLPPLVLPLLLLLQLALLLLTFLLQQKGYSAIEHLQSPPQLDSKHFKH